MKDISKYCVDELQTIKEAVAVIHDNFSRCVVVLNADKSVIGVFSEGDVLRAVMNDMDIHTPLKKVVRPSFFYLTERDITKAYELVRKHGISLVPIVDDRFHLKDVITIFELIDHLALVNDKT